jgi:protein-S-isoprenylcysteine O-methyltransferase Ste14
MTDSEDRNIDRAKVRVPPVVFFLPMVIAVVFHYFVFPLGFSLPVTLGGQIPQIVVGSLIALIGFGLQGLTYAEFQKTGQSPDVGQLTTSVIRTGPYRFSRNPMYLGAVLIHLGVAIGIGSIWVLVTLLLAIAMVYFLAIIPEEQYLEQKFSDEYFAYKASVRRWL